MALDLEGMRIAILATDMVEESELIEPRDALMELGADVKLVSPKDGEIIAANHFEKSESYEVDATLDEVEPTDFDAFVIPGGALNSDFLRVEPRAQSFVQQADEAGKPIAFICHGAWLLVSAGLVEGRRLTSFHTIADDITNAGGEWINKAVVIDDNWVSSRSPDDIPQFNEAMIGLFADAHQNAPTPA